ncbi:MAG: HlyD family secretion protein [Saprospiraceae bacterium]
MYEDENFENRSEEVQEILGTPPPWLLRYGTVLILFAFVVFAWLSFWIEYPDMVVDPIRITFKEPPVRFRAQEGNYIESVLVQDNQAVKVNQVLLVFRNTANFNHVLYLSDQMKNLPNEADTTLSQFSLDTTLIIGELQADLYNFYEKQSDYRLARMGQFKSSDIQTLQRQISSLETALAGRRAAWKNTAEKIDQGSIELKKREMEYKVGKITSGDLSRFRSEYSLLEEEREALEAAIRERQFEIGSMKGQILSVRQGGEENRVATSSALVDAYLKLKLRLNAFMKKYFLTAPFDGTAQIIGRNVAAGQFVDEGDELLVVMPTGERQLIGEMQIPFEKSGTVKTGQRVVIRINGFPYPEYGSIIGEVSWKSKVTRTVDRKIVVPVEVKLPQPLVTNTNRPILSEEELSGEARIITTERRFIERVLGNPESWSIKRLGPGN